MVKPLPLFRPRNERKKSNKASSLYTHPFRTSFLLFSLYSLFFIFFSFSSFVQPQPLRPTTPLASQPRKIYSTLESGYMPTKHTKSTPHPQSLKKKNKKIFLRFILILSRDFAMVKVCFTMGLPSKTIF